ncbi:MAG TPA: hypothetical protein VFB60_18080 [Ktedonobacteraceae bacterium]|nr:hypothetical protein [Ktedonobacteraceae bacterium]
MEETTGRKWLWRILDFINPLRDPSLTVAAVLTFIEEAGQHETWYWIIAIALVNWLAVRGIVWLIVNFTFAFTFMVRRVWWAIKHPRLAWRILDAVGHEEIVIGGLPTLSEGMVLQDGTMMHPMLGASGIHIIGELPAGTELPVLGLPGGSMNTNQLTGTGFFPGANNNYPAQSTMAFQQMGNNYVSPQSTDGLPQSFSQRSSAEEAQLRQQLEAYARLIEDWIQFTEEKWRTISDSQIGWKPLRGRWGSWDDIFQDVYAAQTSDPLAHAAQVSGEATSRRFDTARDKGSAASAVACFMRDMMTLRRGIDIVQQATEQPADTPMMRRQPVSQPLNRFADTNNGPRLNGTNTGTGPRNSLIRRPAQIFVDADSEK